MSTLTWRVTLSVTSRSTKLGSARQSWQSYQTPLSLIGPGSNSKQSRPRHSCGKYPMVRRRVIMPIKAGHGPSRSSDFKLLGNSLHTKQTPRQESRISSPGATRTLAVSSGSPILYHLRARRRAAEFSEFLQHVLWSLNWDFSFVNWDERKNIRRS